MTALGPTSYKMPPDHSSGSSSQPASFRFSHLTRASCTPKPSITPPAAAGMEKKRVVIVGAGVSGLTVCKHLLELGCQPTVFEADTMLGGVWARAMASTKLQTPRSMYQYSDFPWPESVTEEFPSHRQVAAYLDAYARHFGVLSCVRFGHRVVGMEYHGVGEQAMAAWEEWAGNGQAFGSGAGEWRLSVADADGHVEVS